MSLVEIEDCKGLLLAGICWGSLRSATELRTSKVESAGASAMSVNRGTLASSSKEERARGDSSPDLLFSALIDGILSTAICPALLPLSKPAVSVRTHLRTNLCALSPDWGPLYEIDRASGNVTAKNSSARHCLGASSSLSLLAMSDSDKMMQQHNYGYGYGHGHDYGYWK